MQEMLDVRTMLLVGALVCLTIAGMMVHYSIARKTYPGFHHWTAGIVGAGVGAVLVFLRGILPDFITIIFGNALIAAMPLLLTVGLVKFLDVKWKLKPLNICIYIVFVLIFIWATYVQPSLFARIAILCLVITIFFGEALYVAAKYLAKALGEQDRLLLVSISFSIAASLFRLVITLLHHDAIFFLEHAGIWQCVSILMTILGVVGVACSVLILNSHRIEYDLKKATTQIEKLANMDGLTNLFNRRYFDHKLQQEFKRLQRGSQPLSLILADIDFFKMYNDTYGHQAGDDCIKGVAAAFRQAAGRVSDIAARYGGEEFVLLLPNTDVQGAKKVANELKKTVASLAIPHKASTASDVVSLSIGIATVYPERSDSPDLLVKNADLALYKSKWNGRNQIHLHV